MIKAKIFGACGYGGAGMIELLLRHPNAKIVKLIDKENIGMPISSVYPHLSGFCNLPIFSPQDDNPADGEANSVFFATPDGVGMDFAPKYLENGLKVVDYSGDFRFSSQGDYALYAERIGRQVDHKAPELLKKAVYGITELNRSAISKTSLVGNPGCFAIAVVLGFAPLVKARIIDIKRLICDAKTGVSGAGKKPSATFHYPARYENMNPYKVGMHQHQIEIERQLSVIAGSECRLTLNTQVVPLTRGIMNCGYAPIDEEWNPSTLYDLYNDFYKNEKFIRILSYKTPPSSADIRGSNLCLISPYVDERTGTCIILVQIDNLVKGQAGSALQNMNLMHGMDEALGLFHPPMFP